MQLCWAIFICTIKLRQVKNLLSALSVLKKKVANQYKPMYLLVKFTCTSEVCQQYVIYIEAY